MLAKGLICVSLEKFGLVYFAMALVWFADLKALVKHIDGHIGNSHGGYVLQARSWSSSS